MPGPFLSFPKGQDTMPLRNVTLVNIPGTTIIEIFPHGSIWDGSPAHYIRRAVSVGMTGTNHSTIHLEDERMSRDPPSVCRAPPLLFLLPRKEATP